MKFTNLFFASLFVLGISSCNKSGSGKGEGPDTLPPIATPGVAAVQESAPVQVVQAVPHHPKGKFGDTTVTSTGLMFIDKKIGKGAQPNTGQKITVNYHGTLVDGKVFDSNIDPAKGHVEPYVTQIGVGRVIRGWDEGFLSMKVGGKRRLIVPSDLAYGAQGNGPDVPPNSTLIFDVELLKVE